MKAAYIEKFGGPEVLIVGDLPDPVAGPGQIVVETAAASINGADAKVCAGEYPGQPRFPLSLGRDFSGVVATLGAPGGEVRQLRKEDGGLQRIEAGVVANFLVEVGLH